MPERFLADLNKHILKCIWITTPYWDLLYNYSNEDAMIVVEGQTHRQVEQNKEARNRPIQIFPTDVWQRCKSNSMKKEYPFQDMVIE